MKLSARACADLLSDNPSLVCIDVRTAAEFEEEGHIAGAHNVPLHALLMDARVINHGTPLLCVCAKGVRSASAAVVLRTAGYQQVYEVAGGYAAWLAAGLPIVSSVVLG